MKVKYIIMFVKKGITQEFKFPAGQKEEAIRVFQKIRSFDDVQRIRLFSIDSEDEEIWYDLGKNY